jgi:hypothetical protein
MIISKAWAMPDHNTFSIKPIRELIYRHWKKDSISVDIFARNNRMATFTNDLNPDTSAEYHLDAIAFVEMLRDKEVKADLVLFDPPYSPRQVSECYQSVGRKVTGRDTSAAFYGDIKNAILSICEIGSTVISFGWNSTGMGAKRGFKQIEILLVNHGGSHNDTICTVEKLTSQQLNLCVLDQLK